MDRLKWHSKLIHTAVTLALLVSLLSVALVPPVAAQAGDLDVSVSADPLTLCCCENTTVSATITNNGEAGSNVTGIVPSITNLVRMNVVAGPDATGFWLGTGLGNSTKVVNWTVHCNAPGAGSFDVVVESNEVGTITKSVNITQERPDLVLEITDAPTAVCYDDVFNVTFNITNNGTCTAYSVGIYSTFTASRAELVDLTVLPTDIAADETVEIIATLHCLKQGNTLVHFEPFGFACPDPSNEFHGMSDAVTVRQEKVHLDVDLSTNVTEVCAFSNFTITVTIENEGNVQANNVTPTVSMSPDTLAVCSNLTPASADIPAGETKTFNITCNCSGPGEIEISVPSVTGTMAGTCAGAPIPQDNIEYPNPVTVSQLKAHLVAELDVDEEVCYCDNYTMTLNVTNTGTAAAINVTPTLTKDPDGANCTGPTPASANISPDEWVTFEWNCHCNSTGVMTVNVTVNGTDNCTKEAIPEDNIEQADPVNVTQRKVHLDVGFDISDTEICVYDSFLVTVTVNNTGNVEAWNVTPIVTLSPGGQAICGNFSPASENISVNGSAVFYAVCNCTWFGNVTASLNVTGKMGGVCEGKPIPEDNINYNVTAINVTQYKAHLNVTAKAIPTEVCPGEEFSFQVEVTNLGNVAALNVAPSLNWTPFDLAAECAGPLPANADIDPGETVLFVWCLECLDGGAVNITVNITGTDECTGEPIHNSNINGPDPVIVFQKEARLEVKLDAPEEVCYCHNFTVTANITNTGEVGASNVTPVLTLDPEFANLVGELPCPASIAPNATVNFTWLYHCNATGEMQITINVTGIDDCNDEEIGADDITYDPQTVNVTQRKVHLDVDFDVDPMEVCVCDNFTVTVNITNTGNVVALNVTPHLDPSTCGKADCSGPFPPSANISANATANFTFKCHCINNVTTEIGINVTGQMGGVCNGSAIPLDNIYLPASVNVTQYPGINITCGAYPNPQHVCHNMTFWANATGGSGNFTFWWDFGDGYYASTQNATHTYMCIGNYTATVTVSDGICDNRTCTVNVTIYMDAPLLISPLDNEEVTIGEGGEVCFNWTDIGCVNYTLEIWQKDGSQTKVVTVDTGKTSSWCGPLLADKYQWHVIATESCGNWTVSENWTFEVIRDITYPDVTVTRPNGGETFIANTTETITWDATEYGTLEGGFGLVQEDLTIDLSYSVNGGATWTDIATNEDNDGAYMWTVPILDSDQCLVRVEATDDYGNTGSDTSDGVFTITTDATAPTVKVNSPVGGENWAGGSTHAINWTATDLDSGFGANPIDLYLSDDGGSTWAVIALGEANDGTYTWTVPTINSVQCLVEVVATDVAGNVGFDTSDAVFTISTDSGVPEVTVTRPNGGEEFAGGTQEYILWDAVDDITPPGSLTIDLYYQVAGGSWINIPMDGVNDGEYKWDVPEINDTQVLVKVVATDGAGNAGFDVSDNEFTIATGVQVFVLDYGVSANGTMVVPIQITGVTDVAGVEIWLSYNSSVIIVLNITDGTLGSVTSSFNNTAGLAKMNYFYATGKSGDFIFTNVAFQAVGGAGDTSPLDLDVKALFDENGVPIIHTTEDGVFTILALMEGDVNLDSCVTIVDAMYIAQYVATTRTLNADQLICGDVNDDGVVNMLDALHIAQWRVDPTGGLGVLLMGPLYNATADAGLLPPNPC